MHCPWRNEFCRFCRRCTGKSNTIFGKKHIDVDLIHPAGLSGREEILKAFRGGKKVVVIKRDPPASYEEVEMYQQFEKEGIVTISKHFDIDTKAIEALNRVLQE